MIAGTSPEQTSAGVGHSVAPPTSPLTIYGATSTAGTQHGVFISFHNIVVINNSYCCMV